MALRKNLAPGANPSGAPNMSYCGAWLPATNYYLGDVVTNGGSVWECTTAFITSGGSTPVMRGNGQVNGFRGSSSQTFTLPGGTIAGDIMQVFIYGQNLTTNPGTLSTWFQFPQHAGPTNFTLGYSIALLNADYNVFGYFYATVTTADVSAGTITIPTQSNLDNSSGQWRAQIFVWNNINPVPDTTGNNFPADFANNPNAATRTSFTAGASSSVLIDFCGGQSRSSPSGSDTLVRTGGYTNTYTDVTSVAGTGSETMTGVLLSGTLGGTAVGSSVFTSRPGSSGVGTAAGIGLTFSTATVPTFAAQSSNWTFLAPQTRGGVQNVSTKTANYTAVDGDLVLVNAAGGNITITVPHALDATVTVKRIDSSTTNTVTVVCDGATPGTIDGDTTATLVGQYVSATFVGDGTNVQILSEYGTQAALPASLASLYGQTWKPSTAYIAGQVVDYQGSKYYCITPSNPSASAITFIAESHANNTTGAALGTVTLPTGTAAGDTVILSVMATTALTFPTHPAGWYQVYRVVTTTTVLYHLVLTHVVTAADVTAGNFALGFVSSAGQASFSCSTYRNVQGIDFANIKSAAANAASSTTIASVLAAITSTTGTMLAIASATYDGSVPTLTYSPAVTASAGSGSQYNSTSAYRAITGSAVAAQTVTATWVTAGVNAQSAVMIPLIPGPIFNADAAFIAYDKSVPRFRGHATALAGTATPVVFVVDLDNFASAIPLLGWDVNNSCWVCPVTGLYMFDWQILVSAVTTVVSGMRVFVNGTIAIEFTLETLASHQKDLNGLLELTYGDTVTFQVISGAAQTPTGTAGQAPDNFIHIARVGAL